MADQMIQAARSTKQNIVEGSEARLTSLKSAIVLTNVARASVEELIQDYEDFLRQRNLTKWDKNDWRVKNTREFYGRKIADLRHLSDLGDLRLKKDPEAASNILLTLCHQTSYLLYKQVRALELKHEQEGGYSEKLYQRRRQFLSKKELK